MTRPTFLARKLYPNGTFGISACIEDDLHHMRIDSDFEIGSPEDIRCEES
jgi:hypothetical protein